MAAYTTIDNPAAFFNVYPYTGTADTWTAHTGLGFEPNMTWHKSRTSGGWNGICDSVRGVDASPSCKAVYSNAINNEESSSTEYLDGYQSDGFTVGKNGSFGGEGDDYVAYCWKMGTTTGKPTAGETNAPTGYSINTTSCQGVYAYTGTSSTETIAHGLARKPGLILVKKLDGSDENWVVYNGPVGYNAGATAAPGTIDLTLNDSNARTASSTMWNDTDATSTVFTLGTDSLVNYTGRFYIAYVFADLQGYFKCGLYDGNSNADGPYVWTGFQPSFVILKNRDSGGPSGYGWAMLTDQFGEENAEHQGFNEIVQSQYADQTAAAAANIDVDLLSNGFKIRGTSSNQNGGDRYIYMAWARSPMVNSSGVPGNAR